MAFEIILTKRAKQDLDDIDRESARRIIQKLLWWQEQGDPLHFAKPMHQPASGDVRFRVGDYRLVALVNKTMKRIEIVKIGHRREVYL